MATFSTSSSKGLGDNAYKVNKGLGDNPISKGLGDNEYKSNAALQKLIVECSFEIDTDIISRDSACLFVKLSLTFQISSIINIIFWQSFF